MTNTPLCPPVVPATGVAVNGSQNPAVELPEELELPPPELEEDEEEDDEDVAPELDEELLEEPELLELLELLVLLEPLELLLDVLEPLDDEVAGPLGELPPPHPARNTAASRLAIATCPKPRVPNGFGVTITGIALRSSCEIRFQLGKCVKRS
jgi:hypothetical protein